MAAKEENEKAKSEAASKPVKKKEEPKETDEKKDDTSESPDDKKKDTSSKEIAGDNREAESTVAEIQEKKVKKTFVDKFRWSKKKGEKGEGAASEESKETSPDEVAEEIYRNLAEIKGQEYFVFRLKKKTVLIAIGVVILLMWLVPLSKWAIESKAPQLAFWNPELVEQAKAPPENEVEEVVEPAEEVFRIRIRNNSELENAAQEMSDFLMENGFEYVEVVDDFDSEYEGVFVVTKAGDEESRNKVEVVLLERYELASPSAELTEDSDFQVVILFGLTTPIEITTPSADLKSASDSTASADLN